MKKIRNINLDLIKIIACIGVVLLHTTMPGFKETGELLILFILFRYLFNSLVFYGEWLFIIGQKQDNISLYTT